MKPINPLYEWAVQNPNSTDRELILRHQEELRYRKEQQRIKERNKVIVAASIVAFMILLVVGLVTSELVRTIGKGILIVAVVSLVLAAIYSFVKEAVDAFMD
jgi:protein-S-isoprenylcysteine O-methyltransferase Ste14